MQCPTDGAVLVMSERSGIEIDYCPTCRGVWLDRGELDKIIERAAREFAEAAPAAPTPPPAAPQMAPPQPAPQQQGYAPNPMDALRQATGGYDDRRYDQRGYDQRGYDQGYPRKKKKDNWLSELFD
jgi:Zn-finger nucleic acid-binding protein